MHLLLVLSAESLVLRKPPEYAQKDSKNYPMKWVELAEEWPRLRVKVMNKG